MKTEKNERNEYLVNKWSPIMNFTSENVKPVVEHDDRVKMARALEHVELKYSEDSNKVKSALCAVRKGVDVIEMINKESRENMKVVGNIGTFQYIDDIDESVMEFTVDASDNTMKTASVKNIGYVSDLYTKKSVATDSGMLKGWEKYSESLKSGIDAHRKMYEAIKNILEEKEELPDTFTTIFKIEFDTHKLNQCLEVVDPNPYAAFRQSIKLLRYHGHTLKRIWELLEETGVVEKTTKKLALEHIKKILG